MKNDVEIWNNNRIKYHALREFDSQLVVNQDESYGAKAQIIKSRSQLSPIGSGRLVKITFTNREALSYKFLQSLMFIDIFFRALLEVTFSATLPVKTMISDIQILFAENR
jgi:hypothetical protein